MGVVRLERQIGGGLQPRHGDWFARQFSWLKGLGGNDDGAVAFAKTGAAIEEDVLIAERGISGKADGGNVVSFRESRFVQRLNIRKNMDVLVPRRRQLVSRQRIKHERIIGIRGVRQLDLDRFFLGLRGGLLARHGLVRFPEFLQHLEVAIPATLIETFAQGVRSVTAARYAAVLVASDSARSTKHWADNLASGVENQSLPEVARDSFVALVTLANYGGLRGLGNPLRTFVEKKLPS